MNPGKLKKMHQKLNIGDNTAHWNYKLLTQMKFSASKNFQIFQGTTASV